MDESVVSTEHLVSNDTSTFAPSTEKPTDGDPANTDNRNLSYLFVPFSSLIIIVFLTVTVIFLLKRKRKMDRVRHHLIPYYNFAPGEEDDWETELLESDGELASVNRRDYNSVSSSNPIPTNV